MMTNLLFSQFTAIGKRFAMVLTMLLIVGIGQAWGETYERLTSIANIDESAQYVLGVDGTGFHYSGTSSWGKTALPTNQTPYKYTLKKAADGKSFTAKITINSTTYYLQIPTSNTFSMATSTGTNTDIVIGTTQSNAGNDKAYAVANKATTTRHLRINGTSGLRSYAGNTGTMAFFYKVVSATKTLSSISVSGQTTTYNVGDAFLFDGTCTAKYSDNSTKTVTPSSVSSPDMNSAGDKTVTISYTEGNITKSATYTITITAPAGGGGSGDCGWIETDISEITSTDNVVITMSKGDKVWALANNKGTGSAPTALLITIANGEITPAEDGFNYNGYSLDYYTWNISTNSDALTFYPKESTSTWLYCTDTNNGVRVGTNPNKTFTIDASSGYLKHTSTSRYVGVYIANPDWRCYDNTTGNIAGQTLKFYKYVKCATETTYSVTAGTIQNCSIKFSKTGEGEFTDTQLTGLEEGDYAHFVVNPTLGYTLSGEPSVKDASDNSVECIESDGIWMFQMPESDVTVSATCSKETIVCEVSYNPGSGTCTAGSTTTASSFNLPSATPPITCDAEGWTFAGWTTESVSKTTTTPDPLYAAGSSYTPTSDITLYAVYSKTEGSGGGSVSWDAVTSELDDWSGEYVIVNSDNTNAMISDFYESTSGEFKTSTITITNNQIPSTPTDKMIWIFERNGSDAQYSLKNKSTNTYAHISGTGSTNAALSNEKEWFTISTSGEVGVWKINSVEYNERCFSYYTGNQTFRTYKNTTNTTGKLYKKTGGSTIIYNSNPECCELPTVGTTTYSNLGANSVTITCQSGITSLGSSAITDYGFACGTSSNPTTKKTIGGAYTTIGQSFNTSINSLQPNTTYYVRAYATNNCGTTYGQETTFKTSSPEYTVTWIVDGTPEHSQTGTAGTNLTNIPTPDDCNATTKFVGWTTIPGYSHATIAPTGMITDTEGMTIPVNGATYYAVFAEGEGGGGETTITKTETFSNHTTNDSDNDWKKAFTWDESESEIGVEWTTYYGKILPNDDYTEIRTYSDHVMGYIWSSQKIKGIKSIQFNGWHATSSDAADMVVSYSKNNNKDWIEIGTHTAGSSSDSRSGIYTIPEAGPEEEYYISIDLYNATCPTSNSKKYRIDNITLTIITANAGSSYSNYTTSCSTTDCAPTDIQYSSDLNSITVSWNAQSATSTVYLYTDEAGTNVINTADDAEKSQTFTGLTSNTTYYIKIVPGGDSNCASPIIPVKTQIVEMDVIEWKTDGIIVDINTSENIKVVLENEVQYGTGTANKAEDLFFSKYFEGSGTMKLVAIYNGTGQSVSLDNYMIYKQAANQDGNWNSTNDDEYALTSLGSIAHGQEIIFYTRPTDGNLTDCSNDFFNKVKSGKNDNPRWIECNGDPFDKMDFNGNDALILKKDGTPIDIIGATETPGTEPNCRGGGSEQGWAGEVTNMDYGKSVDDPSFAAFYEKSSIDFASYTDEDKKDFLSNCGIDIENKTIDMTTARCILFRDNSVTRGVNTNTGATFDSFTPEEWNGRSVCQTSAMYNAAGFDSDGQATCNSYQDLGSFNYSDYYTKYDPMPNNAYDQAISNGDGTWTVRISNLNKQSCRKLQVIITNTDGNLLKKEQYKVPIMIDESQTTAGPAFIALQTNLATIITDGEGNVTGTQNLELDEVREICKECDVVILDNATLTKAQDNTANDHPQVHDVVVYEGGSLVIPDGESYNYTINNLSLRRKGDKVASVQIEGDGELVLPESTPVTLSMRIDATNWHWFTLPYNCNIADVTWSDGTPAKYGTDWFLMWYDGESRAASTNPRDNHWKKYNGSTIEAGKGYIIGITGNLAHSNYTFELRFPMVKTVLTNEQEDKTVPVNAWGVNSENTPNNKGWNLVGNPYLNYYQPATSGFKGLPLIKYTEDLETGEWSDTQSGDIPYLVTPVNGGWSEYQQELASNVDMLPFTAYFVQVGDPETHTDGQELQANFEPSKRGRASLIRRAPSEVDEQEEPAIVAVELTNSKGESDKTTLLIADRFTDEYEMNADFFKWFGDYYKYYTKPVLYTLGADNESRAFNALNEQLAAQPVELGMFAAQAGNYTFSLNQRSNLTGVAEVWLHDANSNTHTNLMQDDYSFSTTKTNGAGRFSLSVKMASKVPTAVDNITANGIWATTQDNQIVINGLTKDLQLWIYDATGKLLHADHTTNYQHSYSVPTSGVYFVRVNGKTEAQTIKVVVE